MLPLPEAVILALAPLAPLFSDRVWLHTQVLLPEAMLAPGIRTVTAALQVLGLTTKRRCERSRDYWQAIGDGLYWRAMRQDAGAVQALQALGARTGQVPRTTALRTRLSGSRGEDGSPH
jgi:hypothetical protein